MEDIISRNTVISRVKRYGMIVNIVDFVMAEIVMMRIRCRIDSIIPVSVSPTDVMYGAMENLDLMGITHCPQDVQSYRTSAVLGM